MNHETIAPVTISSGSTDPTKESDDSLAELQQIIYDNSSALGSMFGLRHFNIKIGKKWATNLETSEVTAGIELGNQKDYTPEMVLHDILHEIAAHLREVEFAPELITQVIRFSRDNDPGLRKAKSKFHNIFSDISGNKLFYALLPQMKEVGKTLYRDILFEKENYIDYPRHLQFLYKIMRQEMILDSQTQVAPEVDAMIDEFRNFQDSGQDLIDYSTSITNERSKPISNEEKFQIWTQVIYPRWLELYEADTEDPEFNQQSSDSGDSSGQFSEFDEEYFTKMHPENIPHDQIDKLRKYVQEQKAQEAKQKDPSAMLDQQLRQETGHGLYMKRQYDKEIIDNIDAIDKMRDLFRQILNEQITKVRKLRGSHPEGALLNPETLAQTYIDTQSNMTNPPAYMEYEESTAEREITGRFDIVLVADTSGSMKGERAQKAASSLVIFMEALSAMQEDINNANNHDVMTDMSIRTAIYTFGDKMMITKPLSEGLTDKERLDSYTSILAADGKATYNAPALQNILNLPVDPERKQIVVTITDGEATDVNESLTGIQLLRNNGWQVYGVSIMSDAAVRLYAPTSQRINDVDELPHALTTLLEGIIS